MVRGTTPFRLILHRIKKPVGAATGLIGQPHFIRVRPGAAYTLCLYNGGNSGAGYSVLPFTLRLQGPFSADVRAEFSPGYRSLDAVSPLTSPFQSLYLLS